MATLRITNLTTSPLYLGDLYTSVPASSYIDVERSATDLPRMKSLQAAMAAQQVTLAVTYSADELASGLMAPPQSVEAQDIAPVLAATPLGGLALIRCPLVAGAPGAPDDVTILAAGLLPFKFRVVDAWAKILTAIGGTTVKAYTRAAGAGTLLGSMASAAAGHQAQTDVTATAVATPAATEGLFIARSDRGVAGEVFLLVRPES